MLKLADAELFAGFGSALALVTVATFVVGPTVVALATMEIVAVPPFVIVPRAQLTVVVPLQEPWLGVAETRVMVDGSVSVTETDDASFGPPFATLMVKVTALLSATGEGGDAVLVIERSDCAAVTVVVVDPVLFAALPSAVAEAIVAAFVIVVPATVPGAT